MINDEERTKLQTFVDHSPEGTPFRRRAQLLLLAADGVPPERSANLVGVTIPVARHFLNAFKKQGMALFPESVRQEAGALNLDLPLGAAVRRLLRPRVGALQAAASQSMTDQPPDADLLILLRQVAHIDDLLTGAEESFWTTPFPAPRRKLYRRWQQAARAHDLAELCLTGRPDGVDEATAKTVCAHWLTEAAARKERAQRQLTRKKTRRWLATLQKWTQKELAAGPNPLTLRLVLPTSLQIQIATTRHARGAGDYHSLLLPTQHLYDSLTLLAPLLGPQAPTLIAPLADLAGALAEWTQLTWATTQLQDMPADPAVHAAYQTQSAALLTQATARVEAAWAAFDRAEWRAELANIVGSF